MWIKHCSLKNVGVQRGKVTGIKEDLLKQPLRGGQHQPHLLGWSNTPGRSSAGSLFVSLCTSTAHLEEEQAVSFTFFMLLSFSKEN